jgi:hypothetical protein
MNTTYATIADAHYIVRAWALYRSFGSNLDPAHRFHFYCMDQAAAEILSALRPANAAIIPYDSFATPELDAVRAVRAVNEFCWTCKPAILGHALKGDPAPSWAVYLDSDMMAFADLQPALTEAGDACVVVTPHRWSDPWFARSEDIAGSFNAGCIAFKNSASGREMLEWWLIRCIEACPAVPQEDIYADQKYLDRLPVLFGDAVHASTHPGFNAAPWNIEKYHLERTGGQPVIDGRPLMLFHFQGLRIHGRRFFDLYSGLRRVRPDIRDIIYRPYIRALAAAYDEIATVYPGFSLGVQPLGLRQWLSQAKRVVHGTSNLALV